MRSVGYSTWSVCLSVLCGYSRTTGYEAAYERYQQLQCYKGNIIIVAILLILHIHYTCTTFTIQTALSHDPNFGYPLNFIKKYTVQVIIIIIIYVRPEVINYNFYEL